MNKSATIGAAVKVYGSLTILPAATGDDGRFRVFDVPSSDPVLGLTVSLSAVIDGVRRRGVRGGFSVSAGLETDIGDVVLEPVDDTPDPRTTVVGRVVDRIGLAVAGARVHVYTPFDVFPTISGLDGTFSFSGVPSVDGELFASASIRDRRRDPGRRRAVRNARAGRNDRPGPNRDRRRRPWMRAKAIRDGFRRIRFRVSSSRCGFPIQSIRSPGLSFQDPKLSIRPSPR